MKIIIARDGTLKMVYQDSLEVRDLGQVTIQRASNIEPSSDRMGWDCYLIGGRLVGKFLLREDAVRAEVEEVEAGLMGGRHFSI